jgi:hypothetical protein
MTRLALIVPGFASELVSALNGANRPLLAEHIELAEIGRYTYDARDDLGYIYLICPPPSLHFAKLAVPIAEAITLYSERGVNVDVDHDGYVFGIELIGRREVMSVLAAQNAA